MPNKAKESSSQLSYSYNSSEEYLFYQLLHYIACYYSEDRDINFPNLKEQPYNFKTLPFDYTFKYDIHDKSKKPTIMIVYPKYFFRSLTSSVFIRAEKIKQLFAFIKYSQKKLLESWNKMSDLERVIKFGCTSFIFQPNGDVCKETNKKLNYTDLELYDCIRKYGTWKVTKAKFKYNFHWKMKFLGWWFCNLFGLKLYNKDEVIAAVYEACETLRDDLAPGETLEDKIINKIELKNTTSIPPRKIQFNSQSLSTLMQVPKYTNEIDKMFKLSIEQSQDSLKQIESSQKKKINRLRDF